MSRHPDTLVPIATITRTQGLKGRVRVRIDFDDPRLFEPGQRVTVTLEGKEANSTRNLETVIEDFRLQHGRSVAKLKGIDSISEGEDWIGGRISIPKSAWPKAEPGSFFSFDVEGCEVYAAGEAIGTVTRVLDYGATTLLQLDRNGEEILIPFVRSFLKQIDTLSKRIDVELPEGLIEINKK